MIPLNPVTDKTIVLLLLIINFLLFALLLTNRHIFVLITKAKTHEHSVYTVIKLLVKLLTLNKPKGQFLSRDKTTSLPKN